MSEEGRELMVPDVAQVPVRQTEREAAADAQLPVVRERAALVRALELDDRIQGAVLQVLAGPGGPYLAAFGPKCRLNASGATRLARAYGVSVTEVSASRETYEGPNGPEWLWTVSVRASLPDGRCVEATDCCSSEDKIHVGKTKDGRETSTMGQRIQTTRKHARERAERQAIAEVCGIRGIGTDEAKRLGIPLEEVSYRGGDR